MALGEPMKQTADAFLWAMERVRVHQVKEHERIKNGEQTDLELYLETGNARD